MAQFVKTFYQELNNKKRTIHHCEDVCFTGDNLSDMIGVYLTVDGQPYTGGGTVSGTVINSRGQTIPITTGAISGNLVTVTLEQSALAVPGRIGIYVKLTTGTTVTTVLAAKFTVEQTETDTPIDPGTVISSVDALITRINTAVESIPADYSELLAGVAPSFSSSTAYTAGQYVWYPGLVDNVGALYRFTADHAAGSWTGTDAAAVALANDVAELKSALTVVSVAPTLRNGSVANGDNTDAVAITQIIPIKDVKSASIIIKRSLSENADHYLIRLNTYSVLGKTGYSTGSNRIVTDISTIYGAVDYPTIISALFDYSSPIGFAIDIFEQDANGNNIPLRITDFSAGDVIITLSQDNKFTPLELPESETIKALANDCTVGFNHFTGKYYENVFPVADTSPLTFGMTTNSICVIVPVGETSHLRYRSNQLPNYVYSFDADLNYIKRSNYNAYAIDFVQNGYVVFRYHPENFDPDTLMIAYTDETGGATTDKWDSLFPSQAYEPYKLIPKISADIGDIRSDIEEINTEIATLKTALTEEDFIEQISKVSGVVVTTDVNTGDKVAAFTATSETKTWAQLSLICKPMTAYLLEFNGRCDFVDYSPDFTQGSMLIIEFFDSGGNKIGEKYNASVLGVGGRRYHRCGAVSPYGAATVKLRVVTRIDGSMELSNVSLRPVYGYQSRSTNGVQFDDHLGCIFTAPRNTMPSFEQAKIAGYNTVICNVKFTKPTEDYPVGVPVVIHNQTIDATSDGTGEVSSYTYDELQEFDFGSWFNKAYAGTKIPTLDEVLAFVSASGMRPAISLHGDQTNEQLDIVADIFAKHCVGKCLIKSFSRDTVHYMYTKLGAKGEYVWDKTNEINSQNVMDMVNAFADSGVTICIETDANYVTAESVALAHAQNVQVGAYNVYDTAQLRKVMMMGVDRITMDFFSDVVVPVT